MIIKYINNEYIIIIFYLLDYTIIQIQIIIIYYDYTKLWSNLFLTVEWIKTKQNKMKQNEIKQNKMKWNKRKEERMKTSKKEEIEEIEEIKRDMIIIP